ncbi:hypothetical protein AMTR_s00171p00059960 [Amborella trichopoda]|uniref:Pentacotripeptide-repeat region of PRORP domain-containing protein n=1 Tax=Amborella trichopoda TaxID=13333 RepID=W1PR13_AMBTC|nr:hypothetical protein AMTR_s00171p00059960 [Amborella trichopoda]
MAGLMAHKQETDFIRKVCGIILKGQFHVLTRPNITSRFTNTMVNSILSNLSSDSLASWSFFKWVESIPNYKHSVQPYWTMIHILTKNKQYNIAQSLVKRIMFREFLSSPSVLNALLNSCSDAISNSEVLSWLIIYYAQSKMTQDAIQIFNQMNIHGFKPHLHACTSLLSALAKEKLTATLWKIHERMVEIGIMFNTHVYNAMIHACYISGDVEKAEKLVKDMDERRVPLDLFSYNTLIALFAKRACIMKLFVFKIGWREKV